MGDRVAVIKDGYLQQVDTPQNLYDKPENVFVAAFIGSPSMNLYDGGVTLNGDPHGADRLADASPCPERVGGPALRKYDGQRVVVGIRPEDLEDAAIATGAPRAAAAGHGEAHRSARLGTDGAPEHRRPER